MRCYIMKLLYHYFNRILIISNINLWRLVATRYSTPPSGRSCSETIPSPADVQEIRRFPSPVAVAVSPGGTTMVELDSSMMAGPSTLPSGERLVRS